ncbi:MAG: hypothetical protein QOJ03_2605 [Frankiaceae bacterium]|nr:hypothetical protein [Frankiaceae bacterium]
MTATSCCGKAPRDITIDLNDSKLAFVFCERCESRQWFRDGEPVSLTSVKAEASNRWNKQAKRTTSATA